MGNEGLGDVLFGAEKPKPTSGPAEEAAEELEQDKEMPNGFQEFVEGTREFHKYMIENHQTENFDTGEARRRMGEIMGALDRMAQNWF